MTGVAAQLAPDEGHHVGQARRHVGEPARPHPDAVTVGVDLHARAIVLVLEGRPSAVGRQHLVEVGGDLREHGQERDEQRRPDAGQRLGATPAGQRGDRREIAEEERGAAHGGHVRTGRLGDGLEHDPVGGAGSHLAADDPRQHRALVVAGPRGQGGQSLFAHPPRARAARLRHRREGLGDIADA